MAAAVGDAFWLSVAPLAEPFTPESHHWLQPGHHCWWPPPSTWPARLRILLNQTAGTTNITEELLSGNYGAGVYNFSGGTNNFKTGLALVGLAVTASST